MNLLDQLPAELKEMICSVIDTDLNRYAWRKACGLTTACHKCLTEEPVDCKFFLDPEGVYRNLVCPHNLGLWAPFQENMFRSYLRERALYREEDRLKKFVKRFKRE